MLKQICIREIIKAAEINEINESLNFVNPGYQSPGFPYVNSATFVYAPDFRDHDQQF